MFREKNPKLQLAIDNLYTNLRSSEYGHKYTWKTLAEIAGIQNSKIEEVYYVVNRVCLMLMRNDQRYLNTLHNFGKVVVFPSEHQLVAKKTANKSVRIYRKAGAILASTNMEELTEEQKKEVIDAANKYSTLEMFTNEMLKKKKIGVTTKEDIRTASLFLDTIKMFAENKN